MNTGTDRRMHRSTARRLLVGSLAVLFALHAWGQQRWITGEELDLRTDGQVTEIPLPTPGSGPSTVAIAPDGTIWFTQSSGNRIGRMAPDGSGYAEYPLPTPDSSPRVMALGADGNMWFSQHTGNRIGRITPAGEITEFPIPTPDSYPRAVALGADGNIWFGMFGAGKVGRITPDGDITEFDLPTPASGPRAVAAGPDGNIWFSQFHVDQVGRITPDGEVTEFRLPRPNSGPGDITAGADGNMWLILLNGRIDGRNVDGNRVVRVGMDGSMAEFDMPGSPGTPINVAVGPDRNIWYSKGDSLGRVLADGTMTEFPAPGGGRVVGLSAGSDRQPPERLTDRLWFTLSAGNSLGYLLFR